MRKNKILIIAVVLLIFLSACGASAENSDSSKMIPVSNLKDAMLAADTTLPELVTVSGSDEQAELNFSYLSDISYDLIEDYFYAYAKDGSAEEIAVICLKDKGDAASVMNSLHDHVTQRQGTFEEYAPEQAGMTGRAIITRQDRYVTLIISNKNGLVQKAFESCFE